MPTATTRAVNAGGCSDCWASDGWQHATTTQINVVERQRNEFMAIPPEHRQPNLFECVIPVNKPDGSVIGTQEPIAGIRQTIATSIAFVDCVARCGCIARDYD